MAQLSENWHPVKHKVIRNVDNVFKEVEIDAFANLWYLTWIIDLGTDKWQYGWRKVSINLEFPSITRTYGDWVQGNHAAMDKRVKLSAYQTKDDPTKKAKLVKICEALGWQFIPGDDDVILAYMHKELFNKPVVVYSVENWQYDKIVWYWPADVSKLPKEPFVPSLWNVYLDLNNFDQNEFDNAPEFIQKMITDVPEWIDVFMWNGPWADTAPTDELPF